MSGRGDGTHALTASGGGLWSRDRHACPEAQHAECLRSTNGAYGAGVQGRPPLDPLREVPPQSLHRLVAAQFQLGEAGSFTMPTRRARGVEPVRRGKPMVVVVWWEQAVRDWFLDPQSAECPGRGTEVVPEVRGHCEPGAAGAQHGCASAGERRRVFDVLEHERGEHHVEGPMMVFGVLL